MDISYVRASFPSAEPRLPCLASGGRARLTLVSLAKKIGLPNGRNNPGFASLLLIDWSKHTAICAQASSVQYRHAQLLTPAQSPKVRTMISEQLYQFDLNGYVVIPQTISLSHLQRLQQFWSAHLTGHPLHDVNFDWGEEWRALIDPTPVYGFLSELFRSRFRLDHMFCVDERFVSSGGRLHHQADMFDEGIFYWVQNQRVHSGLVAVQYALTDTGEAASHFCCIPGSHRGNFPVPERYREIPDNPMLRHPTLCTGDALVFSEAMVHGTYVVPESGPRRAVYARYMNNHSYFRKPNGLHAIKALPATPNHAATGSQIFKADRLTPRQRQLVIELAYARGHAPIEG